nr:hypothetical protein [Tanacetum cinerariifolium]
MGYVRTTGKDLDIISIDDLYNNFKIVEQEVKRTVTASSSLGSQNIAFLSSPDSTNEVDTANNQVSIVSTPVSTVSTHDNTTNLSDATVYVFLANLPNWSQLMHEDLEQIHEDDLKEIDLKWQLALLSMRAKRYFQRTGNPSPQNQESRPRNQDNSRKTVNVEDTSSKVMVAIDGAGFDWSYMADDKALTNMALMALSDSEFNKSEFDIATYKRGLASIEEQLIFYKKNEVMFYDQIAVLKRDASFRDLEINALNLQIEETNSLVFALQGDPQDALKDQGYFESGCSRHMTGNISYLTDFKKHDGGYVDELKVMCDKKNSVLFTETECFVLSLNFKLVDESHVLLKVPRKNNMYSSDMKNIVPQKDLTCLLAKATNDESMLWHMRLATKDETSKILNSFMTEIENLMDKKVKIIRCDNRTKFKNRVMNEFCKEKGIKREYSVARTPQVLVVKPHFKTLYELFRGRSPALSFMRPFGFYVTILNTLDQLGKFDGKLDEGIFVGYSTINQLGKFDGKLDEWIFVGYSTISKAFRVYNTRTRKVKENLHITFLENKPMIAGGRPEWLFDVDALSESMNYAPVPAGTNSNDFADNSLFDSSSQDSDGHNKDKHGPSQESECDNQERPNTESSTKIVNTDGLSINIANANDNTSSLNINTVIPPVNTATPTYADYPSDPLMPNLEDSGILDDAYDDRDKGAEAEYNNLETIISVSPIPSTRVHKDHPKEQIISEVHSVVQTRKMAKQNEEGCSLS